MSDAIREADNGGLLALARNRQMPDSARPNVTLGEVRAALAADDSPSEGLTVERVYEAIRPEYRQPGPGGVDTIPSAEVRARDAAQRIYQRLVTDPSRG